MGCKDSRVKHRHLDIHEICDQIKRTNSKLIPKKQREQRKIVGGKQTTRNGNGTEGGGNISITLIPALLRVCPGRNDDRMIGGLSCGNELPNGFLDRSR
jgi:hypothetical protein